MIAIINLLTNIFITGTSIIGCATIINKIGKFCKTIEENNDGYKLAFDTFMMDSIDEMNRCVESINTIGVNVNNITFIVYDIVVGNKKIKKNKDGKLIICSEAKIYSGYKDKIDELKSKVKKYENELKKMKSDKNKNVKKKNKKHDDESDEEDEEESISSDDTLSDIEDELESEHKENNTNKSDDEFTLDSI